MTVYDKMQLRLEKNPFLSLTDVIYEIFAEDIINYNLLPETALIVSSVAEQCCVSRTPVKAAFDLLTKDGFLDQRGRNYFVKPFTTEDYLNYYYLRTELEAKAIRSACMHITPAELSRLRKLKIAVNQALHEKHRDDIIQGELQFHRFLVSCSAKIGRAHV